MTKLRRCLLLLTSFLVGTIILHAQEETGGRKLVHILHADTWRGIPHEGRTINRLTGNVQLMHNEAIMSCDSADIYGNNRFKAFGNIIIIKNTTKLYGETLDYNGDSSIAKIRGKIVRLEDEKAVLRTFNLDFNTKENTGYFFGGGTLADTGNVLESARGYYYSDLKLARFEEEVEMHNKEYQIRSDSLHYHTDKELSVFLGPTSIWHKDGFLSCENGWYDKPRDYFHFARKAYVMSEKQEMWADSIFYDRMQEKSDLYGNLQILDTTRSMLAFGNEAHLINETQDALLTRRPSVAYYETDEKGNTDTLFLRADTLHFVTLKNPAYYTKDSIPADSTTMISAPDDSTAILQQDTLKFMERKIFLLPLPLKNAYIPLPFPASTHTAHLAPDTLAPPVAVTDSLQNMHADSLQIVKDTVAPQIDSVFQYLYAFRNVKIFRSDGQGACDSLVYYTNDTLGTMYYNPVLWSEDNQITADKILFIGKNQQINRIEFLGNAFAIAREDSVHFNQIKSQDMHALFRDNNVYLVDILNNVQTIFFNAEDSVVTDINFGESSNMQVNVHNRKITRTKYIENQKISIHPLGQVNKEQERFKGFNWNDAGRPKNRYHVCERNVRPSQRINMQSLEKPKFPITEKINTLTR